MCKQILAKLSVLEFKCVFRPDGISIFKGYEKILFDFMHSQGWIYPFNKKNMSSRFSTFNIQEEVLEKALLCTIKRAKVHTYFIYAFLSFGRTIFVSKEYDI